MSVIETALAVLPADTELHLVELQRSDRDVFEVTLGGTGASDNSRITFKLTGVSEYRIIRPTDTFTAEDIRLAVDDPVTWDYGKLYSVFGNAPLPDPPRFFLEFYRLIKSELGSRRDPVEYLNWQESFSQWLGLVYSRSYNLLTGPLQVAEGACKLLEAQALEYTILPDPREITEALPMMFEFGRSWIVFRAIELTERAKNGK